MPSVNLESAFASFRTTSGRRVACEPLDGDDHSTIVAADALPESFWISKDAEFDWVDRNAFLERKESTRGNTMSSTQSNSNSQRFSQNLKSKSKTAALIGLPKTQTNSFCEKRRCKNIRLFPPKRPESVGKSTAQMNEPSSPKVSCIGRVRSKRYCRKPEKKGEKPVVRSEPDREEKRIGFCGGFLSVFRSERRRCDGVVVKGDDLSVKSSCHRRKNTSKRCENIIVSDEPVVEPAGLGGMKRFVSGRRTESWGEVE
ncbi:Serine/arginine-rich SC35-like splicing factor [Heracleum sosnowskyi]|uniref:Serine/arginine-rich SC35-like splicing factor n=1 Tax=Heracleum sosnowskyi TaxID=360622 RepID=A0AAD8IR86_9APIA|nr:Serine/arginine-rich SC35-like splicing factor [Heracleum sosnowskyi]